MSVAARAEEERIRGGQSSQCLGEHEEDEDPLGREGHKTVLEDRCVAGCRCGGVGVGAHRGVDMGFRKG